MAWVSPTYNYLHKFLLWVYFGCSISNGQFGIAVVNYVVTEMDKISLEIGEKCENAPLEMISTQCIEQLPTSFTINIKQRGHL